MSPNHVLLYSRKSQQGSMLVIALFVIVVLAFLGLTITKMLSATTDNVIYEVLGQRALNAARTGLECNLSAKYPIPAQKPYCVDLTVKDLSHVSGLENCRYTVSFNDVTVKDRGKTFTYSDFTSTGKCEVGNIIVTRTIYVDSMR
ncbi:MSHA biogenesis protein MshP [Paraglaciecola sp.]|uniref:MSHA biogenesis protein MshP n=1 Tax=Paraglaciecola sp. TaxID=1920173 RepID=UPI0030F37B2A